jgi:Clostripain family
MTTRPFILFCTAILLASLSLLPAPNVKSAQDNAAPAKAEWTLLMYTDADNDLELDQMEDVKEMLAAGSTKEVNIVMLADRHPNGDGRKYTNDPIANLKNWTTAKLLYVDHNQLEELDDWGEANMGDPATLKRFLQTAVKSYPAQHYGIVFEDHGTGWPGACSDESNDDDMLTADEIAASLKQITATTGKFELIGFDTCLMGNFEVAKALAPYGQVMVASEELEPGEGWDYTPMLQALHKSPKMNGLELGHVIVDTYQKSFQSPDLEDEGRAITLGVIALDQIGSLEKAVNDFARADQAALAKEDRESWLKIADARSHSEDYGKTPENEGTSHYDLLHLAQNLKQAPPNPDAAQSANAVIQAMKNVVVYRIHGSARPHANGLSIFFPSEKEELTDLQGKADYLRTAFSLSGKWLPFLNAYTGVEADDTEVPAVGDVSVSDGDMQSGDVTTVSAQTKADDIDEVTFVLASRQNNTELILGAVPAETDEKGQLKESWDGEWFTVGDEQTELICPITDFEELNDKEDTYLAEVPAQVRFKGTNQWFEVTLYFSLDFNDEEVAGEFIYAFENTKFGPREIELGAGDDVRPVYLSIDAKGNEHLIASDAKDQILHLRSDQDLKVGRRRVPKGTYEIGFVVTDFAGNTTEKFTTVKME